MIWWTFVLFAILGLLLAALTTYTAVVLVARHDAEDSMLGIAVTVAAVTLAGCYVMVLPMEVALLRDGAAPGAFVAWIWPMLLVLCVVTAGVLAPFAMMRYEAVTALSLEDGASDSPSPSATRKAAGRSAILTFILASVFALLWLWIGVVEVPADDSDSASISVPGGGTRTMRIPMGPFLACVTSALGWCFSFVFCGVGLAAVPIGGIRAFLSRPHALSALEYEAARARIHSMATHLLDSGRELDGEIGTSSPTRSQRRRLAAFHQQSCLLEATYAETEATFNFGRASVIRQYIQLSLSILSAVLSAAWVLHLVLCVLGGEYSLLTGVLVLLDGLLPLLGAAGYAVLAFYLLWCTVVGFATVSSNLLVFRVFPMGRGTTTVDALLFNGLLTTLASMAALQLCTRSFAEYARGTVTADVFARYAGHISGVAPALAYLPHGLVIAALASVVWLLTCPRCRWSPSEDSDEENPLL